MNVLQTLARMGPCAVMMLGSTPAPVHQGMKEPSARWTSMNVRASHARTMGHVMTSLTGERPVGQLDTRTDLKGYSVQPVKIRVKPWGKLDLVICTLNGSNNDLWQ